MIVNVEGNKFCQATNSLLFVHPLEGTGGIDLKHLGSQNVKNKPSKFTPDSDQLQRFTWSPCYFVHILLLKM